MSDLKKEKYMTEKFMIGPQIVTAYKRLSYKAWYALAEFVDNSTESYFNNKRAIDKTGEDFCVSITHDRKNKSIRIVDNAYGMSKEELIHAFNVGSPPKNITGRSEFGLGLKTAAFWFGHDWTITTKQLNNDTEYSVTLDETRIANGETNLDIKEIAKPSDIHYTILEIRNLHRNLNAYQINNTKEYLGAIYRKDIIDKRLKLKWDNVEIVPAVDFSDDHFLTRVDQTPYRTYVNLTIDDKMVTGWIGVLKPGSTGRKNAGFTIIRRGRAIATWVDAWRPDKIFGTQRNDLLNQRLTGELHLDEFEVSHTKDAILFDGNDEEKLIDELKSIADGEDLINVAKHSRKGNINTSNPAEKEAALKEVEREMKSPGFVDTVLLEEVPPPDLEPQRNAPLLNEAKSTTQKPDFAVRIGDKLIVKLFIQKYSFNDPYYAYEIGSDGVVLVAINENHPAFLELAGEEAYRTYIKHVTFDAVAEWKCRNQSAKIEPGSIRQIKDELFRKSSFEAIGEEREA